MRSIPLFTYALRCISGSSITGEMHLKRDYISWFAIATVTVFLADCSGTKVFDNDLEYTEPETGGVLRLKSKGKISKIVDLDSIDSVKRVLCRNDKILVALKKDKPDVDWGVGQLVVGSSAWNCTHNVLKPDSRTIYAKISSISRPKQFVVELKTEAAGPLDIFDDATIMLHYEQGKMVPTRRRRYLSNPLRKVLNHVNWNATFTENIPFNLADKGGFSSDWKPESYPADGNGHDGLFLDKAMQITSFVVAKPKDETKSRQSCELVQKYREVCTNCRYKAQYNFRWKRLPVPVYFVSWLQPDFLSLTPIFLSLSSELKVYKIDNKAVVQKYVMDMDVNTHIQQNVSFTTDKEVTLTKSARLWTNKPVTIFQTQIFEIQNFPPVILTVNYSSQANIELTSTTKNATNFNGYFELSGRTALSQRYDIGKTAHNDVTVYNWTAMPRQQNLDTNYTTNTSFAFFQNMTVSPAISWAQKDVDMKLGPPIHISTRPRVTVTSTTDTVSRCGSSTISVDSNVTVAETDFVVDAFGIPIWNVKIMNKLARKFDVLKTELMHRCHADCHGMFEVRDTVSMEEACGEPSGRIIRGDERFRRLHQIWGNFIYFSDANMSATCQYNTNMSDACAERIVTTDMASSVTRLAKFVKAEWPDRKILVSRGYDETNNQSGLTVFQEARAAEVMVSKPITTTYFQSEDDQRVLQRFSELAVCSKFGQVKRNDPSVLVCVDRVIKPTVRKRSLLSRKRRSGHVEHLDVEKTLMDIGEALHDVKDSLTDPPSLGLQDTYPSSRSLEQACGGFTGVVSQDNIDRFHRLVEYPLDDVQFLREGPANSSCGVETRQCADCSTASSDVEDHWSWCGTRTMTMRSAIRLQRLAVLTNNQVVVEKALSTNSYGKISMLYKEGRAIKISLKPGSSLTIDNLTSKAILAGFDSVRYSSPNYIEVCTKIQDGLQAHLVQFPEANLIGVPLPLGEEAEYNYPSQLQNESRKPLLFDSSTSADNIGERFKLRHFTSPGKRFIRLDPLLIELLELAYDEFKGGFNVIPGSGYRPRSVNMDNIDTRHPNEKLRYQMGQAVEVKPNNLVNTESLFRLAVALIKVAKTVRMQRIAIGIGSKVDRLYFEIWPMQDDDDQALHVWQSQDSAGDLFRKLKEIEIMVSKGGTVVSAREDSVICSKPVLGDNYFYFNFDLDQDGYCWVDKDDFCAASHESRYNMSQVLQRRLTSAAGTGKLPRPDIISEIEDCVINTCGGCPSAGTIWKQKVIACTKMVLKYLSRASVPFQPLKDKVSVFNTENHESGVHSQACHDGNICIENTQIYSLLMPLLTATFKYGSTDELLFGGSDNPSPLLEIVEQELAWRAAGKVNVFVEDAKDINAMRNVIKILMVLNQKVTGIIFHIDPDADEDDVITTLQRKIEQWSASVCPSWSRMVTTPYEVYTIPRERKRRSLERSKDRNKMKLDMKNWEIDWLLKS